MTFNTKVREPLDVMNAQGGANHFRGLAAVLANLVSCSRRSSSRLPRRPVVGLVYTAAPVRRVLARVNLAVTDALALLRAAEVLVLHGGRHHEVTGTDGACQDCGRRKALVAARLSASQPMSFSAPVERRPLAFALPRAEQPPALGGIDDERFAALLTACRHAVRLKLGLVFLSLTLAEAFPRAVLPRPCLQRTNRLAAITTSNRLPLTGGAILVMALRRAVLPGLRLPVSKLFAASRASGGYALRLVHTC